MEVGAHFIEHTFWCSDISVPQTLKQACVSPDSELWEQAMQDKISLLTKNNTFTICKLLKERKAVSCKWIYTVKADLIQSKTSRQGFTQVQGNIDHKDTFSPTLCMSTF